MSDVLGSAVWSSDPGYHRFTPIGAAGTPLQGCFLLLGESNVRGHLHIRPPVQHILSIAQTRSGKGVSLIIPNLLTYRGSVLVVDPKGENAWVSAEHRRQAFGQKIVIVDPWGEVNRRYGRFARAAESSARFNPLSILKPGTDEYVDDLAYLADALVISQSSRDPHWDDSARELVAGLIAFVVESPQYRDKASLGLVRAILSLPASELRIAIKDAQKLEGGVARAKLGRFDADTTEILSIMSNARTQTAFLDSDVLTRNMDESDFSFDELCGGGVSVYLVLPPDKLQSYARWLRLMVSIAIRAVARRGGQGGLPTLFVLDEFGTIGRLEAVAQAYGLMAGLGMIIWAFVQDLNQLKRDYAEYWETFIGNSQAITSFGVMDNFTADYISKMLGISTIEHVNVSTSVGKSVAPMGRDGPWFESQRTSVQTSTSTSTQIMSRSLMNPDEIRGMSNELCLIMGRFPPIIARRICYFRDWRMLHAARVDPHFPRTENVRWLALQDRLFDAGSVAGVLAEQGYRVKGLKRKKYQVTSGDGTSTQVFDNASDLWSWAYVMVMDGVNPA